MMELTSAYRQKLEEPTLRKYIKRVARLDYERALAAAERCIDTNRQLPSIAEFLQAYRDVRGEGIPNAAAYYAGSPEPSFSEEDAFAEWRQRQIVAMDDVQYWRYLTDREYRRDQEARWLREWQRSG